MGEWRMGGRRDRATRKTKNCKDAQKPGARQPTDAVQYLSCLLTLHTAVMSFEILFPFGLWVFGPGWLQLNHSRKQRAPASSAVIHGLQANSPWSLALGLRDVPMWLARGNSSSPLWRYPGARARVLIEPVALS